MNRKILLICLAFSLAFGGLWLLTAGIARAAALSIPHRPTGRLLNSSSMVSTPTVDLTPTARLTPSLRLVGPNGETLLSPPVYRIHTSGEEIALYVRNPLTLGVGVTAELLDLRSITGKSVPAMLGLWPPTRTVAAGGVGTFTLRLVEGWLPQGMYSGSLGLSAVDRELASEQSFLLMVTPWRAELEWAQKAFIYVVNEEHDEAEFWITARYMDVYNVQVELTTLIAREGVSMPFSTVDFFDTRALSITRLTRDSVISLTLPFDVAQLPRAGTYEGMLRLTASNAAPITAPFTLVVPEERARGYYRLEVAELSPISATTSPQMPEALQFTGVRRLPGSTDRGQWWPVAVGAALVSVGLATLVVYIVWTWWGYRWTGRKRCTAPLIWLGVLGLGLLIAYLAHVPLLDLTRTRVGERSLLIWESQGRGPVRNVRMSPGEVTSEGGRVGQIYVVDRDEASSEDGKIVVGDALTTAIRAQSVLTVPVGIRGDLQPGVYRGHILIQSPDIAGGVKKVAVQVAVHDFILWPTLVILLGVVVGGGARHLQEVSGRRVKKAQDIERAWQKWDDYMLHDPIKPDEKGARSSYLIYENVRRDLDHALQLLKGDSEWGINDAGRIVSEVEKRLKTYQRLGRAIDSWREDLRQEQQGSPCRQWVEKVEGALRRGDLHRATILMGKIVKAVLPRRVGRLCELVEQAKEAKKIKPEKAESILSLLTKAEDLCEKDNFSEAWQQFKEAEYQILALGLPVTYDALSWDRESVERAKGDYVILPSFTQVRYRVRETIPLKLVNRGGGSLSDAKFIEWSVFFNGGKTKAKEGFEWSVSFNDEKTEEGFHLPPEKWIQGFDPGKGASTRIEFHKQGRWKVIARFLDKNGKTIEETTIITPFEEDIKSSGMEVVYRDKRRLDFNRQLVALLVALVGGMIAKKVFSLTFGSFEDYLGAFAWGVGVSAGVDPVAGATSGLRDWMGKVFGLTSNSKDKSKDAQTTQSGQEEE